MSIYSIGVGALNAAQAGLVTTNHNISNANTPGYSRQQTVQTSQWPLFTGAGFFGQGVVVDTVKRIFSDFLQNQLLQAEGQQNYLGTYYSQMRQVDNMLADTSAGLSPSLTQFFQGVSDMAANPSSIPGRQSMIGGAQSLVARFQALNDRFGELRDGVNTEIATTIDEINSYAQQIASLNQNIMLAESSTYKHQANDLRDQRDYLVSELNKLANVNVIKQDDGSYSVFIGNGQGLVVGPNTYRLAARPAADDLERVDVFYETGFNSYVPIKGSLLSGGKLGGLLAFRENSLDAAQNALGRVAIGLATTFNAQHQLGMDLNGNLGQDFFNVAVPRVVGNTNNSPGATVTVAVSDVGQLTTSDYRLDYDGANYTLVRLSDNTATTLPGTFPGTPYSQDGFTISAPTMAAGDSFLIQPTRNGARDIGVAITDTAKIAAAVAVRSAAGASNTGSGTISAPSINATPVVPNPAHPTTDLNLQQPVTITFNNPPTTFNVVGVGTGNPVNVPYTPGADITYNGWTMKISGAPAAGDTFTVDNNTSGVTDNRNGLLLAGLQTKKTLIEDASGNATTSYLGAYGVLVSEVGNKTRELQVTSTAQDKLAKQVKEEQQSVSGVNLDEEAANLIRYQQAYQAAGKMLQVATTMFDTLLSLGG